MALQVKIPAPDRELYIAATESEKQQHHFVSQEAMPFGAALSGVPLALTKHLLLGLSLPTEISWT